MNKMTRMFDKTNFNATSLLFAVFAILFSHTASSEVLDYYVVQDQAEPFQIQDKGTNHHGIITDILYKALEGSKYTLDIHTYPFNRMMAEMSSNQHRNWVTYGSPLWGDMQSANLSIQPIFDVEHSILSSTNSTFTYKNPEDLDGKVAVLLLGFNYPGLDGEIESGALSEVRVKNHQSAFRVVNRLKDIGGFVEMDLRLQYHLKRLGFTNKDYKLESISNVIPNYGIHIAFSPGIDHEIKEFIDNRLEEMVKKNEIEVIIAKYQ
ncbi:amino acid ABC transporter [Enterovibrio norvegicus]|uniref:Polar amino acid transport system substrate-binding protein n=3 Tax=Enterovibrio norvegicus TaxID=188144 RepID=A0A1I5PN32_9GAMM|nr:amino acid ABC transporter [Enterovibrio norvegicus]OEF56418.1 amino acid ABC transporter [Enterovibrio norvegicus]SFP35435.1 polar amino acid transport system substrate-binding protein [Enterovibrio norvegicus DSM 15893]